MEVTKKKVDKRDGALSFGWYEREGEGEKRQKKGGGEEMKTSGKRREESSFDKLLINTSTPSLGNKLSHFVLETDL